MENKHNEIKNMLEIINESSADILDTKSIVYEQFIKDYLLFLNLVYNRLQTQEKKALNRGWYDLGNYVLSFGTDEFIYEYKEFAEILRYIDKIRGLQVEPNKYDNTLVEFRTMFYNFHLLVKKQYNSKEALELFESLTRQCLARMGFTEVKTCFSYGGSLIFDIDIVSRIHKLINELYALQNEIKRQNPGTYFITDKNTINNFVIPRLDSWDIKKEKTKALDNRNQY